MIFYFCLICNSFWTNHEQMVTSCQEVPKTRHGYSFARMSLHLFPRYDKGLLLSLTVQRAQSQWRLNTTCWLGISYKSLLWKNALKIICLKIIKYLEMEAEFVCVCIKPKRTNFHCIICFLKVICITREWMIFIFYCDKYKSVMFTVFIQKPSTFHNSPREKSHCK